MNRTIFALLVPLMAGVADAALISETAGSGPSSSTIVVDFGPESYAFQVRYTDSITGLDALRLLDEETPFRLETVHFSFGDLVSGMAYDEWYEAGVGNNVNDWWKYWRSPDGSAWTVSGSGAGARLLTDGAWDGWTWVRGQTTAPDVPLPEPSGFLVLAATVVLLRRR
ncbi:MAG TPA: hypothetical protein VGQ99_07175 [Tepidisphaeraceae bacterium]|jgi:hypothetical protein|nr:hypothetical protein [Tepidisphaeraceae bacterium]